MSIKVGIAGVRGLSTILGFQSKEGVEVAALCDLNEEVLKEKSRQFNIPKTFRIFDDMLESDIDAVVIATPMQCHVPQALAALEAGKHVLSEVTAGVTMDELWWLIEAVEKSGKTYMFAENYCYMPENQLVRAIAQRGMFGEIYYGEGEYLHETKDLTVYPNGKKSWRSYWQFGKRGTYYPTHSLGPVMMCLPGDRVKSIATFGSGRHVTTDLRTEDTTTTMCQLESGKLIKIRMDGVSPRPHNETYYQIQGTKGCYEAPRGMGDVAKIWLDEGQGPVDAKWRPLSDFDDLMPERYKNATQQQKDAGHRGGDFFIVSDFVDSILGKMTPEIDVYKACEWTAVALLSELSITNGSRMMDVPNFRKNMPFEEQFIRL